MATSRQRRWLSGTLEACIEEIISEAPTASQIFEILNHPYTEEDCLNVCDNVSGLSYDAAAKIFTYENPT